MWCTRGFCSNLSPLAAASGREESNRGQRLKEQEQKGSLLKCLHAESERNKAMLLPKARRSRWIQPRKTSETGTTTKSSLCDEGSFRVSKRQACRVVGRTATLSAGPYRWRRLMSRSCAGASASWPGVMSAGAGDWSTGGSGRKAGSSITNGCNGSGARRDCSNPYLADASDHVFLEASWSCYVLSISITSGRSISSSTKPWIGGHSNALTD